MQRIFFVGNTPTLLQRSKTCVVISPTYRNQQNFNRDTKILVAKSHPNTTKIACHCAKHTYRNKIMGVAIKTGLFTTGTHQLSGFERPRQISFQKLAMKLKVITKPNV